MPEVLHQVSLRVAWRQRRHRDPLGQRDHLAHVQPGVVLDQHEALLLISILGEGLLEVVHRFGGALPTRRSGVDVRVDERHRLARLRFDLGADVGYRCSRWDPTHSYLACRTAGGRLPVLAQTSVNASCWLILAALARRERRGLPLDHTRTPPRCGAKAFFEARTKEEPALRAMSPPPRGTSRAGALASDSSSRGARAHRNCCRACASRQTPALGCTLGPYPEGSTPHPRFLPPHQASLAPRPPDASGARGRPLLRIAGWTAVTPPPR